MKDVAKQPRLLKRGSTYYLRVKVPNELRAIIGKTEVKESLKTGVHKEALELVRAASARVDAQFAAAAKKLRQPAPKRREISKHEIQQMAMLWLHKTEAEQVAAETAESVLSFEDREAAGIDLANELGALRALASGDDPDGILMVQPVIHQLMKENEIELEPTDPGYKLLFGFVRRAMMENVRRRQHRLEAGHDHKAFDDLFGSVFGDSARPTTSPAKSLTVDELIDRYRKDPARGGVSEGTWSKYNTVFRLMREELGRKTPIREITRDDFARIRDILNVVPANTTKKYPKKTFAEVAEMAKQKGLAPMSVTTAKGHLHSLSSIFNYAVKEELVEKNKAHGLTLSRAHERRKEERRLPFDTSQLQSIFSASMYSSGPGKKIIRDGRFWVPLLSLWTGMRLNECCQLALADIQSRDGTDVILVRETDDGGQRLKTKAATRTVPIHPELVRIGFLQYVEAQRKAKHKLLFPELPKSVRGYYSDLFSKWFGRFLKSAGAKKPLTSFHSFRHNFRDALREAHVDPSVAKVLGGWEDGGTDASYGVGYKASTLAAALEKIAYPDLDLRHLYI